MKHIIIKDLVKKYSNQTVIDNINMEINRGEMVSLLGPSGCGKTTLLRTIAGFEKISSGDIIFNDKVVNNIKPNERNVSIVFQDYAVFPTMTVFANVAYGLKVKGTPKSEIFEKVMYYLELVGLEGYDNTMPSKLSGGQLQRVALARALATDPDVLLLDEPLSNLDAALRLKIRQEIRKIQKKLGITAIFVTHDQEEALSVSDRIYVMNQGKIMQEGSPSSLYQYPENDFVAGFIGRSNILYGKVEGRDGEYINVSIRDRILKISAVKDCFKVGQDLWLSIRPQYVRIGTDDDSLNCQYGKVRYFEYLGPVIKGEVDLFDDITLNFELYNTERNFPSCIIDEEIAYAINPSDIYCGNNIVGIS